MMIYCCYCTKDVKPRLTDGREIYPHRKDLSNLPFWICRDCGNYVGCYHKTSDRTKPLGIIPTSRLRKARGHIHQILDPLWKRKPARFKRKQLYQAIAKHMGWREFHTGEIRTLDDAREIYLFVKRLSDGGSL